MDYLQLRQKLMRADSSGSLYDKLFSSMVRYVGAVARLESAGMTHSPQLQKYASYRDVERGRLGTVVGDVNKIFSDHHPPIKPLPTDDRSIDALVLEMVLN